MFPSCFAILSDGKCLAAENTIMMDDNECRWKSEDVKPWNMTTAKWAEVSGSLCTWYLRGWSCKTSQERQHDTLRGCWRDEMTAAFPSTPLKMLASILYDHDGPSEAPLKILILLALEVPQVEAEGDVSALTPLCPAAASPEVGCQGKSSLPRSALDSAGKHF